MGLVTQFSDIQREIGIFWVFILLLVLALCSVLFIGYWGWLAAVLVVIFYVISWFIRLRRLYCWYRQGSSLQNLPTSFGVLTLLVKQRIREKNKAEKIKSNNKELIQQFRTMVEALPYATLLLNKELKIKYINERAEYLFGVSQADIGQSLQQVFADSPILELFDDNLISKEQAAKEGLKMAHHTDPERLIKTRLIKANRYRMLLLAHDISAMEALQQSRKAFIANASHELRTPLTVISGYLEHLQGRSQDMPEFRDAITQAYEQTKRMAQIIGDMLELSRIEHDRVVSGDEEIIDMPQLLNNLFNDLKHSVDAQGHELSAQIDSQLDLKGNPSEITSVCLNLLHNAILHTPENSHIRLQWSRQNGQAQIEVKDNGGGIDNKHLPHLTERFYRITPSSKQKQDSTGLGLAIVKHIGLKHDAELNIESQKGKGSCFRMIFPANRTRLK